MNGFWRIEVAFKKGKFDSNGEAIKQSIKEDLLINSIEKVETIDVFELKGNFSEQEIKAITEKLFIDPILHDFSLNKPFFSNCDWVVEVKLKPGVTDNIAIAALEGIKDILGRNLKENETIKTAKKYLFYGSLSEQQVKTICSKLLANELIESFEFKKNDRGEGF
jgi:phosphoribosylformylglycinamidine (FGAM) synthase PurS component